jgi:hypothetical protein
MRMAPDDRSLRAAEVLLWLVAAGTTAFWVAFLAGVRLSQGVECSHQLQLAQIPSNAWIVATACLGAIGLHRRRRWGLLSTIAAASAGVYIGLFDITFNLYAGTYSLPWADLVPELFANLVCTALPAYLFLVVFRAPAWP